MKNKKLLLIITASVLAVALIVTGVVLIFKNVGDSQLYMKNQTALSGDTVSVPIYIKKNPGVCAGVIIIKFDSDKLDFNSCANGEVFDICSANESDGEIAVLLETNELSDSKRNGLTATLEFTVKNSAEKGDTAISFVKSDTSDETNFSNSEAELVEFDIMTDGVITIK